MTEKTKPDIEEELNKKISKIQEEIKEKMVVLEDTVKNLRNRLNLVRTQAEIIKATADEGFI